ncbi:MAG: PilZ domain-containing protein [Chitinivibrionales bacterium]|nr:PilZ domain-containing protein [Chitinivibrionales bacterium]
MFNLFSHDRRKNARYRFEEKISVTFNSEILTASGCSDISLGGMCIILPEAVDVSKNRKGKLSLMQKINNETVVFEADFASLWNSLVSLKGKQSRLGIKFVELNPHNFENLCKIIDNQTVYTPISMEKKSPSVLQSPEDLRARAIEEKVSQICKKKSQHTHPAPSRRNLAHSHSPRIKSGCQHTCCKCQTHTKDEKTHPDCSKENCSPDKP